MPALASIPVAGLALIASAALFAGGVLTYAASLYVSDAIRAYRMRRYRLAYLRAVRTKYGPRSRAYRRAVASCHPRYRYMH